MSWKQCISPHLLTLLLLKSSQNSLGQIRSDKTLGLIWIESVTRMVFLKYLEKKFFITSSCKKAQQSLYKCVNYQSLCCMHTQSMDKDGFYVNARAEDTREKSNLINAQKITCWKMQGAHFRLPLALTSACSTMTQHSTQMSCDVISNNVAFWQV